MRVHSLIGLSAFAGTLYWAVRPGTERRAEHIRGIYYAHRGLHRKEAGVPENSLAAFQKAIEAGYGIEFDVQLTGDGQAVVFHDASLRRVCNVMGKVRDYTYEELQQFSLCGTGQKIPLLKDVLALVDGRVPLLVELKCETMNTAVCEKTDELLKEYQGPYVIESFHPAVLAWYRKHRPEVCRGQLSMNFLHRESSVRPHQFLAQNLLFNFWAKPDFIAYDVRDQKALVKSICRTVFGCPCAAWTVRSPKQLEEALQYNDAFIFEGFLPKTEG